MIQEIDSQERETRKKKRSVSWIRHKTDQVWLEKRRINRQESWRKSQASFSSDWRRETEDGSLVLLLQILVFSPSFVVQLLTSLLLSLSLVRKSCFAQTQTFLSLRSTRRRRRRLPQVIIIIIIIFIFIMIPWFLILVSWTKRLSSLIITNEVGTCLDSCFFPSRLWNERKEDEEVHQTFDWRMFEMHLSGESWISFMNYLCRVMFIIELYLRLLQNVIHLFDVIQLVLLKWVIQDENLTDSLLL